MLDINKLIIQELIKAKAKTPADLAMIKRKTAKKYKISCPSNIALLKDYHKMKRNKRIKKSANIENLLITRPIRSLSGIVNVSVLTKPYPCPGKCIYCPQEKGIPKSYLSGEPAVERAKRLNYDPYLQVQKRLEMLEAQGHPIDKIELRIIGGTWSFYPKKYQTEFVKKCFDAANQKTMKTLEKAQNTNEKAKHRIIGLSIETRPDFIDVAEIKRLRKLGATMVELGVQSIYDDVLKLNLRGHKVKETILATKLLKDAGFKVLYQMMPNLFGSCLKKDAKMFEEIFQNPDFQPDLLKIYPCALLRNTLLFQQWKKKKYKPYTEKQLIELIKFIKKKIPYYVRIQRITRDIPAQVIVAGPAKISNLRQIIAREAKKEKWQCKCIRCREVRKNYNPKEKIYLFRQDYQASGGTEIFLSFENKKRTKLYSLLRLRISKTAIIRELHTYGQLHPIGDTYVISPQHKGLGKKLVKQAEKITKKEFGVKKIAVISGVGARQYWRKLGYKLKDTFMVKSGKF
ncbi:tRNA uridine(34) 5-carboxymethylaminomethyl modification radical SAM/GNAT enzyme Elp3 [Candidatus Parcubacteria bacterium]|nr:tRNA uridine(34) 5-carboxymethylaminomethyl modification radical SAM/GNAT enzyme Elp3 [Candidatus Parcubacteria bacterium]